MELKCLTVIYTIYYNSTLKSIDKGMVSLCCVVKMENKGILVLFRVINPFLDSPWPKNRLSVEWFFIAEIDPVLEKLVTHGLRYIFFNFRNKQNKNT